MRELTKTQTNLMYRLTARNSYRPALEGLHYKDGFITATDANHLMTIKADYNSSLEGKTFKRDGSEVDIAFPRFDSLIEDKENDIELNLDAKDVYKAAKNIKKLKFCDEPRLEIAGVYFRALFIFNILNVFKTTKNVKFIMREQFNGKSLIIKGERFTGLVMSVLRSSDGRDEQRMNDEGMELYKTPTFFTMEEALKFTDFKPVNFILFDEIHRGLLIDSFEVEGEQFELVSHKKGLYLTHNRNAQVYINSVFSDLTEAKREARELLNDNKIKRGFEIPDELNVDFKVIEDDEVVTKRGKIASRYDKDGINVVIVRDGADYHSTFDGYSFDKNNILAYNLNNLSLPSVEESFKERLCSFLNKHYDANYSLPIA